MTPKLGLFLRKDPNRFQSPSPNRSPPREHDASEALRISLLRAPSNEDLSRCIRLGDPATSHIWKYESDIMFKKTSHTASISAEAETLRLVRENTSIPGPRVLKTVDNGMYIEFINGESLDEASVPYTTIEKSAIITQLRGYFNKLSNIKGGFIGSVGETPCNDHIFASMGVIYGPYSDDGAFRSGLIDSLRASNADPSWTEVVASFVSSMPSHQDESPVLTHCNIVPSNILARDGKVVGIVGWGMAGFYPAYWEYVKGHLFANYRQPWMREWVLDQILNPYPVELRLLLHTSTIFTG